MKQSDLRKLYISVVRLYGFVFSDELFEILDHYKVPHKKEQILKDLQDRSTKLTRGYVVELVRPSLFLVVSSFYDSEEFEELYSMKQGKPRYYPKTYESLLEYSNWDYRDEKEVEAFNNLFTFLKRHFKNEEYKLSAFVDLLIMSLKNPFENLFDETKSLLDIFEIHFSNMELFQKFFGIIQNANNNLRMTFNNGFTPLELLKLHGPADPNKMQLTISKHMKQLFLDGVLDPYDYLSGIEDAKIPPSAKASFKKDLLQIIEEINKSKRKEF